MIFLQRFSAVAALMAAVTLAGCYESPPALSTAEARQVTEHRFVSSIQAPSKALGEDCKTAGHSECRSGLCLRVSQGRGGGYVCSQSCQQPAECPEGWACVPTVPGGNEAVCMPPPK